MELPLVFHQKYEVIVVGAGMAGVAAALEAARSGLRTALVEKTVFPGGLATTGMVNIYLPLCDGKGTQVSYGIAEELMHLSLKYGPGEFPLDWREQTNGKHQRLQVVFSPASFILALDEVLETAGIDLWFDSLFCQPVMDGQQVVGVEIENKSGRGRLSGQVVIDATGDADVAHRSAAACAEGDNWLSIWALQAALCDLSQAVEQGEASRLIQMLHLGADAWGHGHPEKFDKLHGTDGKSVSRFVLESRRLLREYYRLRQAAANHDDLSGRECVFPLALPSMAQFRTTRRIIGLEGLADGQHGRYFNTSIGLAADWRRPGFVWEIPFGALLPRNVRGLLVAGRCIASEGDAWEVTRVIPAAVVTGQAAGLAASLAVKARTFPDCLDIATVQAGLRDHGIPIHLDQVGL